MDSSIADVTYTGNTHTPAVAVYYSGKALVQNTDYTISYANNINAGVATASIAGKGNYQGKKTAYFTIKKASITKAKYAKVKTQKYKNGKAIKPNSKVTYKGKTLKRNIDYTVTYKNNKEKGTATI